LLHGRVPNPTLYHFIGILRHNGEAKPKNSAYKPAINNFFRFNRTRR
jgi:hypothetical protein